MTISEILISISLLAMMLVTTLVLFTQLLASTTKNGHLETASVLADRVLEQAIQNPRGTSPAFIPPLEGEESRFVEGDQRPTKFIYRLDGEQLGDVSSGGERWLLEVEVRWWSESTTSANTTRSGYGELRTKQSRLVYIKW